jgi:hypothetical protein
MKALTIRQPWAGRRPRRRRTAARPHHRLSGPRPSNPAATRPDHPTAKEVTRMDPFVWFPA